MFQRRICSGGFVGFLVFRHPVIKATRLGLFLWLAGLVALGSDLDDRRASVFRREVRVNLTQAEQDWLKAHPEVHWGADPNRPPFSTINRDGELEGIDADITRLAARRAGVRKILVRTASWSEAFEKAMAGDVDFLSATAKSTERLRSFDYSNEYGRFPEVIVTRDDSPFFTSIVQLRPMIIAVQRGGIIAAELARLYPDMRLIPVDTVGDALKLVSQEQADAVIENLAAVTSAVRLNGLTNLKISGVTQFEFPLHFAVRKNAPELVSILNKGLATITRDELEIIYASHLTPDIAKARDWGVWRRRALSSVLIGLPVLAAVLFWNRYLLQQIRCRKKAEASLSEAKDRLEKRSQELDQRVTEIERLNRDLHIVNQELESFTSAASHDLRAPVRRTGMFADMIATETEDLLPTEAREWLNVIVKEAGRMDQLITDLLAFGRLGRAELHKEAVDMTQLVNETINDFRPQLENREVLWTVGNLGEAHCDPDLLHHVLTNLIDNALKYSRRSPQAEIKIDRLDSSRNGEEVFYVQDNGCGFDMKQAGALFTPFQRLHSDKEFEGTGIGLANVKKIIQRHGGRIWCESQPNKGATFFFSLPTVPVGEQGRTGQVPMKVG